MDAMLPMVRCPCRKDVGSFPERLYSCIADDIFGWTGYTVAKEVRIRSAPLGIFKTVVMLIAFCVYFLYYVVYLNKSYLETASIRGSTRMQLQHPVDGCNPLSKDCQNKFRPFDELPYCSQAKVDRMGDHLTCEYLDAFDVSLNTVQAQQVLFPTRYRRIRQKQICNSTKGPCERRFDNVAEDDSFVADVESFTLLVDHSFVCEALDLEAVAAGMQGFIRPCGQPYNCELIPINAHPAFEDKMLMETKVGKKLQKVWGAVEAPPIRDLFALPNGDVFRLGYLFDLIGLNLSKTTAVGSGTLRKEGALLLMDIVYHNYKRGSLPNQLPPVYEYRFDIVPFDTYKATNIYHQPWATERVINSVHGVLVQVHQDGRMGGFSVKTTFMVVLEATVLFAIVRWFVTMVSLNWNIGKKGDALEAEMCHEVEFVLEVGGDGGESSRLVETHPTQTLRRAGTQETLRTYQQQEGFR